MQVATGARLRKTLKRVRPEDFEGIEPNPISRRGKRVSRAKVHAYAWAKRMDPFMKLGDAEVYLVLSYLNAKETEPLRRVSKFWKTTSEFHLTRKALLSRFPWAASRADQCENREESSLLFRRCLYFQQCLKRGLATRAIQFDDARHWDIKGDKLLWSNCKGEMFTRSLRSSQGAIDSSSAETVRFLCSELRREVQLQYIQLISGSELLVTLHVRPKQGGRATSITTRIVKTSTQGVISWIVDLESSVSQLLTGESAIYCIRGKSKSQSGRYYLLDTYFLKLSLQDGSIQFDVRLTIQPPPEATPEESAGMMDGSLQLSRDESIAYFEDDYYSYIHSTTSGEALSYDVCHTGLDNADLCHSSGSVIPSLRDVGFLTYSPYGTSTSRYIEDQELLIYAHHTFVNRQLGSVLDLDTWAYDGYHNLIYHLFHDQYDMTREDERGTETLDPFASLSIIPMQRKMTSPAPVLMAMNPGCRVTLPAKKSGAPRRDLNLDAPWEIRPKDFFGMKGDYLVIHSRRLNLLVVVDFWPTW